MTSTDTALGFWSFYCRSVCAQLSMVGFISVLLIIGLNKSTLGQNSDLIFKSLSVPDGLSHATAHHVMQDEQGLIWISTRDGLNRYNGQQFNVFKHQPTDTNSLSANMIWLTIQDSQGLIWIGTGGGGLNVYDPDQQQFYRFRHDPEDPKSISGNTIISLFEDASGTIWAGTESKGLNKVIRRKMDSNGLELEFEHYKADPDNPKSISNNSIMDLEQRRDGYLWIATYGGGINRMDIKNETFTSDFPIGGSNVMSLAIHENQLWAGTKYHGLSLLNLDTNDLRVFQPRPGEPNSISSNFVWPVFVDREGDIWAGTFGGGLNKISANNSAADRSFRITSYKKGTLPGQLNDNYILSVMQDDHGVLWAATDNSGVAMFRKNMLFQRPDTEILNSDLSIDALSFNDFLRDQNDTLWMATASGLLYRTEDSDDARFLSPNGSSKVIDVLAQLQDGRILAGTNVGLYVMNEDRSKLIKKSLSLTSAIATVDRVYDIVEDPEHNVWLSTNTGLWKLNAELEVLDRFYHHEQNRRSLSSTNIGTLMLEEDTLWIGTSATGLNKLNIKTGRVTQYRYIADDPESIGKNKVLDMLRDSAGRFWVTTYGGGLNRLVYQDGEAIFKKYLEKDGLPDNTVKHLTEDSAGYLWITTQNGLVRFNPDTEQFVPISIPSQSANVNLNNIIPADMNDYILTGSKGYQLFDPRDFLKQREGLPLLLTNVKVMGKEYPLDSVHPQKLMLPHDKNFLTLEFSLLDYFSAEFAHYQYKMEGIDRKWIHAGNTNRVRYSALPPGDYTFRVKAISYDGVPGQNEVAMAISIAPPFWKSWWFRLLVLAGLVVLLRMGYKYRVNALLEIERTRRRIANDLHDDISSTLSSITYFARALRVSNPELSGSRHLDLILDSSTDAKEKISDIVWSIDPDHDDWVDLLARFRRYASDLFESKGIDYDLDIIEEIDAPITLELRKELWLIYKEMVINVARHSQASHVQISLEYDDKLTLVVEDNGIGLPEDYPSDCNGIRNIKRRAAAIGAEISLYSTPNKGTKWELTLNGMG